jgi:hypothetical protein
VRSNARIATNRHTTSGLGTEVHHEPALCLLAAHAEGLLANPVRCPGRWREAGHELSLDDLSAHVPGRRRLLSRTTEAG